MVYGNISDKIEIKKEATWAGTVGAAVKFGINNLWSYNGDTNSETYPDIDGSLLSKGIYDKALSFSGDYNCIVTDARYILEAILGTLTEDAGAYTVTSSITQPSYNVVFNSTNTQNLEANGVMFNTLTFSANKDDLIRANGSWLCKEIKKTSTAISTGSITSNKPFTYLGGYVKIGSTELDLDSFEFSLDRRLVARRGIENIATNEKRLITSITSGGKLGITFTGSGPASIVYLEQLFGGATLTDYRTDATIVMDWVSPDGLSFVITIVGAITVNSKEINPDADIAMMNFSGIGHTITGAGVYPNP